MENKVLFNNLIAITTYVVVTIIFLFSFSFFKHIKSVKEILAFFALFLYIIILLSIYFICGRLFLYNTHNVIKNICSVIALPILIFFISIMNNIAHFQLLPFAWIGYTFSPYSIAEKAQKYIIFVSIFIPSFMMWLGMYTAKK